MDIVFYLKLFAVILLTIIEWMFYIGAALAVLTMIAGGVYALFNGVVSVCTSRKEANDSMYQAIDDD